MVPGYGFVLNDALVNFNLSPPLGSQAPNDPGPNKRPRGNTAPVLVFDRDVPVLASGTWGGARIPSVVLQVVSNVLDHGMTVEEAVTAPRFSLGMADAAIRWEVELPAEAIAGLAALGHPLRPEPDPSTFFGSAESLVVDVDTFALRAVADPRSAPDASGAVLPAGAAGSG